MSLTISELESERAKILDEIENRAQTFSTTDSTPAENSSLKDWLNAAEEVMPEQKTGKKKNMRKQANSKSNYSSQIMKAPKNSASFFGVIIMLSLLLTLIGVLYIAYTSIHKELQSVLETNQQTVEKMVLIQTDMVSLQKSVATGGKADLFISLEDKVFALESQINSLQEQLSQAAIAPKITPQAGNSSAMNTEQDSDSSPVINTSQDRMITESVLDQKLKTYTSQLEERIDKKLETILNMLSQNSKKFDPAEAIMKVVPKVISKLERPNSEISALKIAEPVINETIMPIIDQPLVRLVDSVKAPTAPVVSQVAAPIDYYTADVKWLKNEPGFHFTLQLASMPDQNSLQVIVEKKKLEDVHIVAQTRKGVTNYVLVTGSFKTRKEADKLARQIKAETNISAWVRKIKDITARIQ
ncbi:MAG: DamX protein [Thiomicrorhabdus sp.]|nr:MAG: DamX protein [Thiomicrorhabdus sp.]